MDISDASLRLVDPMARRDAGHLILEVGKRGRLATVSRRDVFYAMLMPKK